MEVSGYGNETLTPIRVGTGARQFMRSKGLSLVAKDINGNRNLLGLIELSYHYTYLVVTL